MSTTASRAATGVRAPRPSPEVRVPWSPRGMTATFFDDALIALIVSTPSAPRPAARRLSGPPAVN